MIRSNSSHPYDDGTQAGAVFTEALRLTTTNCPMFYVPCVQGSLPSGKNRTCIVPLRSYCLEDSGDTLGLIRG